MPSVRCTLLGKVTKEEMMMMIERSWAVRKFRRENYGETEEIRVPSGIDIGVAKD